jgi:hypothetical protein
MAARHQKVIKKTKKRNKNRVLKENLWAGFGLQTGIHSLNCGFGLRAY